jgi:hypothetical protein
VIDVDAVMADLRERVAEKKARGLYGVDALIVDRPPTGEPFSPEELERVRGLAVLHYDLNVGPSTKPVLGRLVTKVKGTLVRGVSQPGFSLTSQLNAYHGSLVAYLARMAHEITRLQQELATVRAEALRAVDAVREAEVDRQRDLGQLEGRVEELADRLRAAEARVAELEGGAPPQG